MIARSLASRYRVTVLEALDRAGGRIHTQLIDGMVLEFGAEFIHGDLPETQRLLREANLQWIPVTGGLYRPGTEGFRPQDEPVAGWDLLMNQMATLQQDLPFTTFLESRFKGDQFATLRKEATAYAEGFDLADAARVSTRALYVEWSSEEPVNHRLEKGYGALIEFLLTDCRRMGCEFVFSAPVNRVQWSGHAVSLDTPARSFEGERVVVTVPVGVLQQADAVSSIRFDPEPPGLRESAAAIGMGVVIRVVVTFRERIWPSALGFLLTDEPVPTWWGSTPDQPRVLTGWVGGSRARALGSLSQDQLQQQVTGSLARIFQRSPAEINNLITGCHINNWSTHPWSFGGYSYATPESSEAIAALCRPVDDTLYFSGEALYTGGSPGTVEAAIVSGLKTAAAIAGERTGNHS